MIQLSKPIIDKEERTNLLKVLNSGYLARGQYVKEFETTFARYIGTRFSVSTSSGTTALQIALLATGIEKGDVIITTPLSFIATSNAIIHCGGRIEFADIAPETFNISPYRIEEILKKRGKNINPVRDFVPQVGAKGISNGVKGLLITHLYGLPCQMDEIMKIVRKYNLILVEDCAQAHGAEFRGKKVGSFGNIAIFSFYGSKNMTTGEGGMITTNNKRLYNTCKQLVDQGRISKFIHGQIGFNYRMSNLTASIGVAQLKKIDMLNQARIRNAAYLSSKLKDTDWLVLPITPKDTKHVFHQYTVRVKRPRDQFITYLKKKGIASAPNYPLPIHKQPAYKKLGYGRHHLPEAEKTAKQIVNIPVHPGLKMNELEKIVKAIRLWKK